MPLASNVTALAQRIATEFKSIRTALLGKENTSAKGAVNGYAGLDSSGRVPAAQATIHAHDASSITQGNLAPQRLPQWIYSQFSTNYSTAGAENLNLSVADYPYPAMFALTISSTGTKTLQLPTVPQGQSINNPITYKFHVLASGANRTFTFASGYRLSTGITSRSFTIPNGQALLAAVEYSTLLGAWVIVAATISAA